jgi:hypothetical protein
MSDVVLPRVEVEDLLVRLQESVLAVAKFPQRAEVWTAAHREAYRRLAVEAAVVHGRLLTLAGPEAYGVTPSGGKPAFS